jgi:hypothetical protein
MIEEQYQIQLLEYKQDLKEFIYYIIYDNLTFEIFFEVSESETMMYFNDVIDSLDFKNQIEMNHDELNSLKINKIIVLL